MENNKKNVLNNQPNDEGNKKKNKLLAWWLGLGKWAKVGVCAGSVAVLATSITLPIVLTRNNSSKPVDPIPVIEYTVTFDTDGGTKIPSQKVKENEMAIEPANPSKEKDLENNYSFKEWQLDGTKFAFSTPITHDITLKAKYDDTSSVIWYSDSAYINGLTEEDVTNETIRGVTVNGKSHNVRLIGINHDVDENDNKLHTTWEFANLISDSDGNSLAYRWSEGANTNDYINSTIRYALAGQGNNCGKTGEEATKIFAAQKGGTSWSSNYNKTILSMLPNDLQTALKVTKKSVGTRTDETSPFVENNYTDKLFMLSCIEMGATFANDRGFGTTYSYYSGASDAKRIKKQVNNTEEYTSSTSIDGVNNYAGYNHKTDDTGGGTYWVRSPRSDSKFAPFCFRGMGDFYHQCTFSAWAFGVAPAFCL